MEVKAYLTNKRETKCKSILSLDNVEATGIHIDICEAFKRISKYIGIESVNKSYIQAELASIVIKHITKEDISSKIIVDVIDSYIHDNSYYLLKIISTTNSRLEDHQSIDLRALIPNIRALKSISKYIRNNKVRG